jgi:hypothetical protein
MATTAVGSWPLGAARGRPPSWELDPNLLATNDSSGPSNLS